MRKKHLLAAVSIISSMMTDHTIALAQVDPTAAGVIGQKGTVNAQNTTGESNRLTVTLTSTHGVSASSTATPDYSADVKANMSIGAGSGTSTQVSDTVAASIASGSGTRTGIQDISLGADGITRTPVADTTVGASGFAKGLGGSTTLNLEGSNYSVIIKPRDGITPTSSGIATGQASGSASTILQIDSTHSAFVNTFLQAF
jgi:hypothetical protein